MTPENGLSSSSSSANDVSDAEGGVALMSVALVTVDLCVRWDNTSIIMLPWKQHMYIMWAHVHYFTWGHCQNDDRLAAWPSEAVVNGRYLHVRETHATHTSHRVQHIAPCELEMVHSKLKHFKRILTNLLIGLHWCVSATDAARWVNFAPYWIPRPLFLPTISRRLFSKRNKPLLKRLQTYSRWCPPRRVSQLLW